MLEPASFPGRGKTENLQLSLAEKTGQVTCTVKAFDLDLVSKEGWTSLVTTARFSQREQWVFNAGSRRPEENLLLNA